MSRYATRGSHTSREANDATSLLATSYGSIRVKYHEVVGVAAAWQVPAAKWKQLPPPFVLVSFAPEPGAGNKYDCFHLSFQLLSDNSGNESKKLFLFLVNFAASPWLARRTFSGTRDVPANTSCVMHVVNLGIFHSTGLGISSFSCSSFAVVIACYAHQLNFAHPL